MKPQLGGELMSVMSSKVVADLHRGIVFQGRHRPAFIHNTIHTAEPQQEACHWLKVPCRLCERGSLSLSQHFRCAARAGGLQHKSEEPGCTSESIMVKLPPKNVCTQHSVCQVGIATYDEGQVQLASPDQLKPDHAASASNGGIKKHIPTMTLPSPIQGMKRRWLLWVGNGLVPTAMMARKRRSPPGEASHPR